MKKNQNGIANYCKGLKDDFLIIKKTNLFKLLTMILCFIFPFFLEKYVYINNAFNFYRVMLYWIPSFFIGFHFIFNIEKMYNFIYIKRYAIGIGLFAFLVIFGYHGSSITLYDDYIQPNEYLKNGSELIGEARTIRSDEWAVSTPTTLSQATKKNAFSTVNKTMMGGIGVIMNFYPRAVTFDYSIIVNPAYWGYLFLPLNQAFSFSWYFGFFLLFFATFEFFMIITGKKKVWSLVGACMITFSPAVQWWASTGIISSGMLAMIFFNKFLNTNKISSKIIYSMLIGYSGCLFILNMYPAWMIPYAYFFLGIVIWMLIENKNKYKIKDLMPLILPATIIIALFILPLYTNSRDISTIVSNTVYPGARFETGGESLPLLFNYITSTMLPFIEFNNASEASQFISFYPIPLLLALYYLIKKQVNGDIKILLLILVILDSVLSLFTIFEIPKWLSKISLLYLVPATRCQVVVGFLTVMILIVLLSNSNNKQIFKGGWKFIVYFASFIFAYVACRIVDTSYAFMTKNEYIFMILLFGVLFSSILLYRNKKLYFLPISLIILSIITGTTVHPFSRTLDVIYEKNISKEIQELSNKNPDSIWATVDAGIYLGNYALANGATVLNSTNFFPNFELWEKIDPENKYKEYWNRYAHVKISIVNQDTTVDLPQPDSLNLNLNSSDLCKLDISYIISPNGNLEKNSNYKVKIENIYNEDNMMIYTVNCIN